MRLGIGSYTYPYAVAAGKLDHQGILTLAQELGANVVQYCENLPLGQLGELELTELLASAKDWGIQIELGTRGLDVSNLVRHFDLAQRVGSGFVRLVAHDSNEPLSVEAIESAICAGLDQRPGATVSIENHDHLRVADLRRLVERLGEERVSVTLDTANSLGCLEGTREVVEALGPFTRCLHVKDVVSKRIASNLGFTILGAATGTGQVDIPWVLAKMTSRCESVIMEQWTPSEPKFPKPVERELESAGLGFSYLKSLTHSH